MPHQWDYCTNIGVIIERVVRYSNGQSERSPCISPDCGAEPMTKQLVVQCAQHGAELFGSSLCLITQTTVDGSAVLATAGDTRQSAALRLACDEASVIGTGRFDEINGTMAVPINNGTTCIGAIGVLIQNTPRSTISLVERQLESLATLVASVISQQQPIGTSVHEQALDVLGQAVVVTDLDNTVLWANATTHQMFELPCNQPLVGQRLTDVAVMSQVSSRRHIRERIAPYVNAQTAIAGTIRFFDDDTAQEQERLRLESLVNTEWLTGVASRRSFEAILQHGINTVRAASSVKNLAVGIFDLDKFKRVNDELGHAAGDQVLIDVAQFVRSQIPKNATLARLGGDEFAVLLRDSELDQARQLGCEIADFLRRSMAEYPDARAHVSASFGFTAVRYSDQWPGDCLRRADEACYHAKERGGSTAVAVP